MDYARKKPGLSGNGGISRRNHRGKRIALFALAALFLSVSLIYAWRELRFRYIVVHHTASDVGNMEYYRRLHIQEHGWPDIAYHFIINNGSANTAAGQVEESDLWKHRSINYSTQVSYVNYFGIAIVLVGNFELHPVPPLQWESLVNLVTHLARKYHIPPERIVGHREISETACPGKYFRISELRHEVELNLAKER